MQAHTDKAKENKCHSTTNAVAHKERGGASTIQFVDNRPEAVAQQKLQDMANHHATKQQQPLQKKVNNTGLPNNLKSGIENLSGHSMDDVKVHYNSDKPAQLNAHAYAQGTNIHLASGQEKHLAHEAWHVVQQKQGRVKPTLQMKGKVNINDDKGLEIEADLMGAKASNYSINKHSNTSENPIVHQQKKRSSVKINRVAQLNKHNSKSTKKPIVAPKGKAAPFQILATQFNAKYDIFIFKDQIVQYFRKQMEAEKLPVFELRMYDGANPTQVNAYQGEAHQMIAEIVLDDRFDLIISWLRDEARDPQQNDGAVSAEMYEEFYQIVESFAKHYNPSQNNIEMVSQYVGQKTNPKYAESIGNTCTSLFKKIGDPLIALRKGKIMLPIPEAYKLYESSDATLAKIIFDAGSIHEKVVAFLVLSGRAKGLKIVGSNFTSEESPPREKRGRQRSNSTVKPEEVAFANLVMGDEEESADLVIRVVKNAFKKGATIVHLIVEDQGMESSQKRIDRQKLKLQARGYQIIKEEKIKGYKPSAKAPAAEQSGIQEDEPLSYGKTRNRTKLTLMPPKEESQTGRRMNVVVMSTPVTNAYPLSFYAWMNSRGYWYENDDAMEQIMYEEYREYNPSAPANRY